MKKLLTPDDVGEAQVAFWWDYRDMTEDSRLHDIMDKIAAQMELDFADNAAIRHSASKGTVREREVQRKFLEKYLPRLAKVTGSGELVSADGNVSSQCDLMIVDADTPPLWAAEDFEIVPVECCYAVIEVKSNLTTEELRKAWTAAKRAKQLPSTALRSDPSPITYTRKMYGREWAAFPLMYFVFAFEGATLDTLGEEVARLANETDEAHSIDAICVLNRGVISWQHLGTDTMLQREPGSVVFTSSTSPGNVLLFLMSALHGHLANARLNPKLDIRGYIKKPFGQVASYWTPGGTRIPMSKDA